LKILVTGGTGFIGKSLVKRLAERQHEVLVLSRNPKKALNKFSSSVRLLLWSNQGQKSWQAELQDCDVVINLAGENLAAGMWTRRQKARILNSRINAGKSLMQGIEESGHKPRIIIQSSAVGFYGDTGLQTVNETSAPGSGFLAEVVRQWESSTATADHLGIRRIIIRTGLVLSKSGGLLPKLMIPYHFYLGGFMGNGKQGFPWIHLEDEIRAITFLMEQPQSNGIYNLAAPETVSASEFARELGKTLRRSAWLNIPEFLVRVVPGGMGEELLLKGQYVQPVRLIEAGFTFTYPDIQSALHAVI